MAFNQIWGKTLHPSLNYFMSPYLWRPDDDQNHSVIIDFGYINLTNRSERCSLKQQSKNIYFELMTYSKD